jgi:flagellin
MQTAINMSKAQTGVSASVVGTDLELYSTGYGSRQYVDVNVLDDSGAQFGTSDLSSGEGGFGKDYGRNASVMINGNAAITDGLTASMRSAALSLDVDLTEAFNTPGSSTFAIVGGGADFMISPTLTAGGLASLGIPSVSTGRLGKSGVGFLSELATGQKNALSTENYAVAQRIVREAEQQVSFLRGRLGAFQKSTLDPTQNSLQVTLENTTAAESTIRDTDFAAEAANLTRAQVLVQSATNTLRMANSAPQTALQLLQ